MSINLSIPVFEKLSRFTESIPEITLSNPKPVFERCILSGEFEVKMYTL